MPINSGQLAVGTAATAIPFTSHQPWGISIHNDDNTDDLFVGGPGVTISNGLLINKLEHFDFALSALDRVHVVSSKTGHNISWLATTRG